MISHNISLMARVTSSRLGNSWIWVLKPLEAGLQSRKRLQQNIMFPIPKHLLPPGQLISFGWRLGSVLDCSHLLSFCGCHDSFVVFALPSWLHLFTFTLRVDFQGPPPFLCVHVLKHYRVSSASKGHTIPIKVHFPPTTHHHASRTNLSWNTWAEYVPLMQE